MPAYINKLWILPRPLSKWLNHWDSLIWCSCYHDLTFLNQSGPLHSFQSLFGKSTAIKGHFRKNLCFEGPPCNHHQHLFHRTYPGDCFLFAKTFSYVNCHFKKMKTVKHGWRIGFVSDKCLGHITIQFQSFSLRLLS